MAQGRGAAAPADEVTSRPAQIASKDAGDSLDLDAIALRAVEPLAIEWAAAEMAVDAAQLAPVNATVMRFPTLGVDAYSFKFLHPATGGIHSLVVDASGAAVDLDATLAAERTEYEAAYGKLEPALVARLAAAQADELIPIMMWIKAPELGAERQAALERAAAPADQAAARAAASAELKAINDAYVMPTARLLADAGISVSTADQSPAIFAALDPALIHEIARWDEVDGVYGLGQIESELANARQVIGMTTMDSRGINGSGVKIGLLEQNGGTLDDQLPSPNPLSGVQQDSAACVNPTNFHTSLMASIIRSTDATHKGIASGCTLRTSGWCNTGSDANDIALAQQRASDLATWGARAINCSWGFENNLNVGGLDRFFDDLSNSSRVLIVKSAGNRGLPNCQFTGSAGDGHVTSPGLGYNVLTVGNLDDRGTLSGADDVMAPCSSFANPTSLSGDRQKPEVAAPGQNIGIFQGRTGSGTSPAAAMVTGVAALLMQREPFLAGQPEALKAIIMAGAKRNIEGDARLSDKDGVGAVMAHFSDDVARRIGGNWAIGTYRFDTLEMREFATINVLQGQRMRIVMVWSNTTRTSRDPIAMYGERPLADLDLTVVRRISIAGMPPTYLTQASSTSNDNTYEVVDFVPSFSGPVMIRLHPVRAPWGRDIRVAVAWHFDPL